MAQQWMPVCALCGSDSIKDSKYGTTDGWCDYCEDFKGSVAINVQDYNPLRSDIGEWVEALDGKREEKDQMKTQQGRDTANGYYAVVRWQIEDVHQHREDMEWSKWTDEQAREWIIGNEGSIQDRMIEIGWEVIDTLMVEEREVRSAIETTPDYWDCECEESYIHKKSDSLKCAKCGATQDEQPDSRVEEVLGRQD